jgi:hypothetical protein
MEGRISSNFSGLGCVVASGRGEEPASEPQFNERSCLPASLVSLFPHMHEIATASDIIEKKTGDTGWSHVFGPRSTWQRCGIT